MRYKIIEALSKYFKVTELVDKEVYAIHGERSWKFFDTNLLNALLIIRTRLGLPITVNTSGQQQRGLRHNRSSMVIGKKNPYLSAHMMGKAVDFDVKGMSAEDVRVWIKKNFHLFDFKIRLEHKIKGKPISWVHLDVIDEPQNEKVYLFNI
jgi:hypothetical protein